MWRNGESTMTTNMTREQLIEKMKEKFNGCPLFEDREKESLDILTDKPVTIDNIYRLTGNNGAYYAVTFKEDTTHVFLSGGGLTKLCDEFGEDVIGVNITILPKIKTQTNHDYRPITVNG